jgi:hypothetical protein
MEQQLDGRRVTIGNIYEGGTYTTWLTIPVQGREYTPRTDRPGREAGFLGGTEEVQSFLTNAGRR